jgi:hypothetical protein
MNTLRQDNAWLVRKISGGAANRAASALVWLKAPVRTIESRRDDLERAHWKKVCRSLAEE